MTESCYFKELPIGFIRKIHIYWKRDNRPPCIFHPVQQSIDFILGKLKFRPLQDFPILYENLVVITRNQSTVQHQMHHL